jgi:hypothetical protein
MKVLSTTRQRLLGACIVALACVSGAAIPQTPANAAMRSSALMIAPQDTAGRVAALKVVDYQPHEHGWTSMWTDWRPTEFAADLQKIKTLGANAIRLCVYPAVTGWPTPQGSGLTHFEDALKIANAQGMQVQLTLFDWWTPYSNVASSKKWMTTLLAGHKDDPRIAMVELINEVDPYNSTQLSWLRQTMPTLHSLMGLIPTTVSVSSTAGTGALSTIVTALKPYGMTAADIHYYGVGGNAWSWLSQAKTAAQGLPLFIGEAGYTTYRPESPVVDQVEQAQAQWFLMTLTAASSLGISVAPYMYIDLTKTADPQWATNPAAPSELLFGIYRGDGSARPAVSTIRNLWAGSSATTATFNTDFANRSSDGSALGWHFVGYSGSAVWDGTIGHNANGSVRFDNTGTDSVLTPSVEQPLPGMVRPGDTWTVSASVHLNHTGKIRVSIAWYDARGAWLGTASSTTNPTTAIAWNTLTVQAKVPAGAVQAEAMLMDALNPGSVWFDDVTYQRTSP